MNINKPVTIGSIILIVLLIFIPSIYKVHKNHEEMLYKAVNDKIINAAKECYYNKICLNEKITLEELYNNNLIEKMNDPVTKEYYNISSYVIKNGEEFTFHLVK